MLPGHIPPGGPFHPGRKQMDHPYPYHYAPPPPTHGRHAKQKPTLLTCDDHQGLLVRMGREVSDARPDITHQVSRLPACVFVGFVAHQSLTPCAPHSVCSRCSTRP